MKRIYQKPETQCQIGVCHQMLASSYVSIGGTGGFDVKEESDWTDSCPDEEDDE